MSIKTQVDDAAFLYHHNRHLGALTNLMLAVAGSSSKIFPVGTPSMSEPPSKSGKLPAMTDGEIFELFLGGRLRKIMYTETNSKDIGSSGILFSYKGNQFTIAENALQVLPLQVSA
jgi:hypothetical protein